MTSRSGTFMVSFVVALIVLLLGACGESRPEDKPGVTPVPTWTPTVHPTLVITAPVVTPVGAPTIVAPMLVDTPVVQPVGVGAVGLPAPLYFIDSASGQIRRIERDGETFTSITHEQEPVLDFDCSPSDGHLVYVSGNNLIASDALGGNRRVIVDGPDVPLVNLQYEPVRYGPTLTVSAPRFAPDGQQLAFGLGGVKLIPASGSTTPVTILANAPYTPTSNAPTAGSYFLPYAWSPDGVHLLVEAHGYWEGIGWTVVDPHRSSDSQAYGHLPTCCDPVWSLHGEAVYLSDASGVVGPPGLRRFVLASGALTSIVEQVAVAFPHESRAGALWAFASSGALAPTGFDKLAMYRLDLTTRSAQLVRLRADDYAVWSVLWARDDRGALIVEHNDISSHTLFTGLLIWLPANGSPAVQLRAFGSHPRWGLLPNAAVTPSVTATPTLTVRAEPGVR